MPRRCVTRLGFCRRFSRRGHVTKSSVYKCHPDGNWRFPLVPHGGGSTSRSACHGDGGRRVEQRQFVGVRCATSLSDPHKDYPRSTFEQGGRAIKVGMPTGGRRCTSARRFRSGRARCVRAYSGPRCMHGRGRLIDVVGSIRSARARASSMHGPTTVAPVRDRKPPIEARAMCSADRVRYDPHARQRRHVRSFQVEAIGSSRSARYGRGP